jgi:hypothetical protein
MVPEAPPVALRWKQQFPPLLTKALAPAAKAATVAKFLIFGRANEIPSISE